MGGVKREEPSVEERVGEICALALGIRTVGLDEDFFDLGGTSLALINVVVEMGKRFAFPLDTSIVTGGATVRALAQAVRERMGGVTSQYSNALAGASLH
jgi:acyl carrier protein